MRYAVFGAGLTVLAGVIGAPSPGHAAAGSSIAWIKDLATARRLAQSRHKLVLQFLMLGDLPDPHC